MSGAAINLQGVAINNPTPLFCLQIDFAVGAPVGIGAARPMLVMGNMTSAGSATPDTVIYGPDTPVPCQSENDVIGLFGAGSEIHRMFRRVALIQQVVSVYFIAVTASAGAAGTLAYTFNVPGVLASVAVGTAGAYSTVITATVAAPTGAGGVTATVSVQQSGMSPNITVTGVTVVTPGSGYLAPPVITFGGTAVTPAVATATVTPGIATVAGNVRVWVDDEFVDTAYAAGATLSQISSAVETSVNNKTYWAANGSQSTVTYSNDTMLATAKIAGPRGNLHRGMALVTAQTGVPNVTVSVTTDTAFTGGTTTDSNATALTTIVNNRYYYIASAAEDATNFGALCTQVTNQALPLAGIRQRCFAGSSDTLANVQTVATGINNPRAEILWLQTSPIVPSELAAIAAAVYAQGEMSGSIPTCNFDWYGQGANDTWPVIAPRILGNYTSTTSVTSALNNGVTPVGVLRSGATYLVKRITSRSLDGAANDYRIRDSHKVTICDFFADDLLAVFKANFKQKTLADDPPKGSTAVPAGGQTVTPRRVMNAVFQLVDSYADPPQGTGLLVNPDQIKAGTIVQREKPYNNNRVSVLCPLQTVDVLDQVCSLLEQVA